MTAPFPATRRQQDVLRYLAGFQEAHGFTPSLRKMSADLGCAAHSVGHYLFAGLIERGHIIDRGDELELTHPVAIPRGPSGEPMFFIRVEDFHAPQFETAQSVFNRNHTSVPVRGGSTCTA